MINIPQHYAVVNANDNITNRLQYLRRALVIYQGDEARLHEIITEILILVGIDSIVMIAYRETLASEIKEAQS